MRTNRIAAALRPFLLEGAGGQPIVEFSETAGFTLESLPFWLASQAITITVAGIQTQSGANVIATVPPGQVWILNCGTLVANNTGDTYSYRLAVIDTATGNTIWADNTQQNSAAVASTAQVVGYNMASCPRVLMPGWALGFTAWSFVGGFTSSHTLSASVVQLPQTF